MWIVTKLPYSSSLKCFHIIKASCKTYSNLTHCASWRQLISSSCSKFSQICLPWKQKQISKWLSFWQGAVPRAQQKWATLKTVECSICQEKSAGGIPDLVLARRKNKTSKCLSLSIEFPSRPWWSETIPWPILLFFVLPNWHPPHTVRYQSHKPCSHLGLLSFCSWKRNHARQSWNNFLMAVMCNHFHISVTQSRHFLCAFYLRLSKHSNQSIPGNSGNQSDPCSAKRCHKKLGTLFPPSRWSESFFPLSEILFHTLFSPHRPCPLPCLTHHRLWAREKEDTQEKSACKGQNWNIQLQ